MKGYRRSKTTRMRTKIEAAHIYSFSMGGGLLVTAHNHDRDAFLVTVLVKRLTPLPRRRRRS